jgi:hypothetical protein
MSKIEVNTVDAQCGSTVTIGSSGKNVKIEGNDLRSNDYKASDGGNIINQSGTTITIGASGDTINLASGASQSGFGRTGTVNWDTTVKTAGFTGVSGNGYFIDTTSGPITVNLPASPNAGDIMALADYAGTAATNNITIGRNSSNITGIAENGLIQTNRDSLTMVYIDGTQGWVPVNDNTGGIVDPAYVAATGGSVSTVCTDFKVHTFTGPGTFCVSSAGNAAGSNTISYLVIAGGGGGGFGGPGQGSGPGGGAGGYRESKSPFCSYTASPTAATGGLPVAASPYPVSIGGGGTAGSAPSTGGGAGANSVFAGSSTITSAGGGGGGGRIGSCIGAMSGGSGAGGGTNTPNPSSIPKAACAGEQGNQPPVNPSQGNPGGASDAGKRGGGGGAGAPGQPTAFSNIDPAPSSTPAPPVSPTGPAPPTAGSGTYGWGAAGGPGATSSINGTPTARAGGGGGGGYESSSPSGGRYAGPGTGGAGGGGKGACAPGSGAVAGSTNTGGGGGGGNNNGPLGGAGGGPGIVIIRYKFQN